MPTTEISAGRHDLLGAAVEDGGVNFALFSYHATEVEVLLFDRPDAAQPSAAFRLDPETNRTGCYWHVFVPRTSARTALRLSPQRALRAR